MVATEMLYHLVGSRELDGGAMVTASHNPKAYTGVKLVREGALPLSGDAGIGDVRDEIEPVASGGRPGGGSFEEVDVWDEYRAHAMSFIDAAQREADEGRRRRRQRDGRADGRADPGSGCRSSSRRCTSSPTASSPTTSRTRCWRRTGELIMERVRETGADLGIAWDGDADRCFFIDASGEFCDGDFICALLARAALLKNPGATILYDPRSSRAVPDLVAAEGGRSDLSRVGHAFFKARMREEGAAFGGEVSGHYYFRDFWNADSGTIPALLVLELLSLDGRSLRRADGGVPLAATSSPARSTPRSPTRRRRWRRSPRATPTATITRLDGVSVDYADWHFNVRPSNTEPLLRLNLESLVSREDMERRRDEVLGLIRA